MEGESLLEVVEQYVGGHSLHNHLADITNTKSIMVGIASGVHYLHSERRRAHLCLSAHTIFVNEGQSMISVASRLNNYD